MFKSAASKVMWVGRTAATIFGVALVLALIFGVATMALAALPGDPLRLGQVNRINDALTTLIGSRSGAMMLIDNDSNAANATALHLRVQPDRAPMAVYSDKRVTYLNADKLDGMHASELAPPRGYAQVTTTCDPTTKVCQFNHSKGVESVKRVAAANSNPAGTESVYCFDLTFTPEATVASGFFNNNATVGTVTPPNGLLDSTCPAGNRDAAARTFAANTSEDLNVINFSVVFI